MQIKQLEYARTIAETGSITQAAQKLFISQQALSETLKLLEAELGFQIFKRSNKGVTPTAEGERFLQDLEIILPIVDSWQYFVPKQPKRQTVKIMLQYLLSDLLVNEAFLEQMNAVENVVLEWETDNAKQVIDLVEQGQFQIGLLHLFQKSAFCTHLEQLGNNSEVAVKKLMNSRMAIALRANDALAGQSIITLDSLQGKEMVQNRAFGEKSSMMQKFVYYTGIKKRFLPQSVNVLEYVLQHENAISYLPEFILRNNVHVQNGKIVMCYLEEDLECALYCVYHKKTVHLELLKQFEAYFLQDCKLS